MSGGIGGEPGAHPGGATPGRGGAGGHGGHGGGAGGGAGGPSVVAISCASALTGPWTAIGGSIGAGGAGGQSAPATIGTSEDDGIDGGAGADGPGGPVNRIITPTGSPCTPAPAMSASAVLAATAVCDAAPCVLGVDDSPRSGVPLRFESASPNPMLSRTTLWFGLPSEGHVRLELFDQFGRRVGLLLDRTMEPGRHTIQWDGTLASGTRAAPGIYLVRFSALGHRLSQRVVLVR